MTSFSKVLILSPSFHITTILLEAKSVNEVPLQEKQQSSLTDMIYFPYLPVKSLIKEIPKYFSMQYFSDRSS